MKNEILSIKTVTASSKVMLPTYPAFMLAVGVSYILGDPSRTSTSSLEYIREVAPLSVWGYMFVFLAVVEIVLLLLKSRLYMMIALSLGMGVAFVWSMVLFATAAVLPDASFSLPCLWLFVSIAHYASLQSITKD